MSRLLKQVEAYRGNGISAGLFYEGKVAEAISLIVEWSRLQQQRKEVRKKLSAQDVQQLENLTLYLNDHCIQDIQMCIRDRYCICRNTMFLVVVAHITEML